jgi:hypothetical protein
MTSLIGVALTFVFAAAAPAFAQQPGHDHTGAAADQVGSASVRFQTSCAPSVAADFNRAVALLHSFWFAASA